MQIKHQEGNNKVRTEINEIKKRKTREKINEIKAGSLK